jgi:hypothetical protein
MLSPAEFNILETFYATSKGVAWTVFVASINRVFEPCGQAHVPNKSLMEQKEREKTEEAQEVWDEIKARVKSYVVHHRTDVRSWFKEYDQHDTGIGFSC